MAPIFSSAQMVEGASKNSCLQYLFPQSELQSLPASPGDSLRPAGKFGSCSNQTTLFVLGWEISVHAIKMKSLFPSVLRDSQDKPRWSSKPNALGAHIPSGLDPWAGEPDVELRTLTLVAEHLQYIYSSVVRLQLVNMRFKFILSPSLPPILLGFLLYAFSSRSSFS